MFTFGREKAGFQPRTVAVYTVVVVLVLSSMLVYIYPSIRAMSLMYEYSEKLKTLSELKELNKKLKLEISALRSYDFIEKTAVEELGFVFPAPDQVVIVAKE
ncbi:MAG: cell division protein FtsL [Candidatus Nitrospinota bacterium M3_3B_026]